MLKRVSIQNFKSLKDVTLDLQKVNLLIGPNNSGKTNFLKALEFVRNYNEKIITDINIPFKKYNFSDLKIELLFSSMYPDFLEDYNFISFYYSAKRHDPFLQSFKQNVEIKLHTSKSKDIKNIVYSLNDSQDIFPDEFVFNSMYDYLGKIRIYRPDPNKIIQPSIVGLGDNYILSDASNIIAFFDYIRDDQPEIFSKIKRDLKVCVPEFSEINFQSIVANEDLIKQYGAGTYKRLGLTNGKQKVKYWADELSEGTLYFLALLCIINQPDPPKILLLEEPEKGIHPRRIREVMDFIFRLAAEKDIQIILTTHNEHVLDEFSTRPESVFVFDKDEEGATYVRNLQTDIIEPTNKRNEELGLDPIDLTTNLSENWLYGLLGGVPPIIA
ncbi:AAA family ATPase [Fibrella sp. WM1]|uniref:AAA family ATPase n=1 Tax=Fibrella musci TaxID=3242485 RepID=UPI0035218AE1